MGKVSSYLLELDEVTCACCEGTIPSSEFNQLDDKYKATPICENCWEIHKNDFEL